MVFTVDLRRQARVCAGLAEDCEDGHLAQRLRLLAADLAAKADELEDLPGEQPRNVRTALAA